MGSVNETKKINNQKLNDSLSLSSVDYKTNIESVCSNNDYINSNLSSNIQSDTRENTKISEIKEETLPYKFIWNMGGNNVKIAGTFLDNWKKELDLKKNIKTGYFEIIINLSKTKHEFKFIVDNKWLCSQQYETIKDKDNYNNIIDLTNYSSNIYCSKNSNESRKKRARKLSSEYGTIYAKNSDFDIEVPILPINFLKSFDLNYRAKQNYLKNKAKTFLNFNLNKKNLLNSEYKSILTISHEKLSHACFEIETDYNNEKYIKASSTQRNNHKFLTLVYYTPKNLK
jgi:hypothetical protein